MPAITYTVLIVPLYLLFLSVRTSMPRLSIPILVFTLQDNEDEIKSKDTTKTKRSGKARVYCS